MLNLAQFLTRIQTFELRVITKGELQSRVNEDEKKPAYSLTHETQYYDSFSYKSEIRVLKDMAQIELLSLDDIRIKRELVELKKLKERFNLFWKNFHSEYSELKEEYPRNYIFSIGLYNLFIVKNLRPDHSNIFIGDEFVESLNDSAKIREKFLNELINEVEAILYPREAFEEWKAKLGSPEANQKTNVDTPAKIPYHADAGLPRDCKVNCVNS